MSFRLRSSWANIEGHLRADHRSRWMRFRLIDGLVRALAQVQGPPLHRSLADFLFSRHSDLVAEIPDADQDALRRLHAALRIADDEPVGGSEHFGFHLWYDEEGRHAQRLWLGLEPPVAAQLQVPASTILLIQGGYLPVNEGGILERWGVHHGLEWRQVLSGEQLPERAIAFPGAECVAVLDDLCARLKLRRTRLRRAPG